MVKVTRTKDWADLDLDFIPHPTTGDVVKKTGVDAIKRAVRNLILTNFYDRPFRSYIGSNAQKILFDNINPLTATFLKNAIRETIVNHEPRVELFNAPNDIIVNVNPDQNGYDVTISFIVLNRGEPVTINLFLERLR
jgi:phage baseplate assembly protein W